MKKVYTILATLTMITSVRATTYTLGSGKWNDAKTWNGTYIGTTIKPDDVVIVEGHVTLTNHLFIEGTLEIAKGASVVGLKDLTIAKSGKLINHGNTVLNRIVNEGKISNNMILEAINNIEITGGVDNNSNVVAGNNLINLSGTASGKGGAYLVQNNVQSSPEATFGPQIRVLYGNTLETAAAAHGITCANPGAPGSGSAKHEEVLIAGGKSNEKNLRVADIVPSREP